MMLWHMHSEVLQGFYSSEVIVMASDKNEARVQAGLAFERYITQMVEDFSCNFLVSSFPWENEYKAELMQLTQRFMEETEKLEQVGFASLIIHRS
jgi:hypothetical protein